MVSFKFILKRVFRIPENNNTNEDSNIEEQEEELNFPSVDDTIEEEELNNIIKEKPFNKFEIMDI